MNPETDRDRRLLVLLDENPLLSTLCHLSPGDGKKWVQDVVWECFPTVTEIQNRFGLATSDMVAEYVKNEVSDTGEHLLMSGDKDSGVAVAVGILCAGYTLISDENRAIVTPYLAGQLSRRAGLFYNVALDFQEGGFDQKKRIVQELLYMGRTLPERVAESEEMFQNWFRDLWNEK